VFGIKGGFVVNVDFDGADIDSLGESKKCEDKGESNEGNGYVVNNSPWVVDCD
jgi:hypothetical protein